MCHVSFVIGLPSSVSSVIVKCHPQIRILDLRFIKLYDNLNSYVISHLKYIRAYVQYDY